MTKIDTQQFLQIWDKIWDKIQDIIAIPGFDSGYEDFDNIDITSEGVLYCTSTGDYENTYETEVLITWEDINAPLDVLIEKYRPKYEENQRKMREDAEREKQRKEQSEKATYEYLKNKFEGGNQ